MENMIAPPVSSSTASLPVITVLNRNDVLLGRGSGPNLFWGNLQFRDIVAEMREAYVSAADVEDKRAIAQSIVDQIRLKGGRFLRRKDSGKKKPTTTKEEWVEVTNAIALEKAKQALREKNVSSNAASGKSTGSSQKRSARTETVTSFDIASAGPSELATHVATVSPPFRGDTVPHAVLSSLLAPAPVDSRLLLFQTDPFALRQLPTMAQPLRTTSLYAPPPLLNHRHYSTSYGATPLPDSIASQGLLLQDLQRNTNAAVTARNTSQMYSQFQNSFHLQSPSQTPEPPMTQETLASTAKQDTSPSEQSKEDDVAAFLLSSLAVSDRPVITAEQEALERENLSDEEKASILADAFGSYCSVDTGRQNKKARKYLDRASIAFLIRLMRAEIDSIPAKDKPALVEAQKKARKEEFSDARLEKFLRVEGMNAKLAAQRFVRYWEGRKETFGPKKYLMRMSLSEALQDDLVALEAAMCYLLPAPDKSGRQLVYLEPRRHTREGYSSESMLRAIWYTFEIAAAENTDVGGGFVQISFVKNSTLWDYDLKVYDRWAYFQSHAWPIRIICSHVCCSPYIILKVVKPIIHAFSDKRTRTRTIMHDAPERDIVSVLAKYGIDASVLPTSMGGQMEFRQSEWIADRFAAELEEIS